jgi:hypothetical protein
MTTAKQLTESLRIVDQDLKDNPERLKGLVKSPQRENPKAEMTAAAPGPTGPAYRQAAPVGAARAAAVD